MAAHYKRIYANLTITRHGRSVCNTYSSLEEIENIPFSPIKGILILDEGGVNNNARTSMSDTNLFFGHLAMLSRKKNLDIIQISQLERMADVYYRELSSCTIQMNRPLYNGPNRLLFEFDILVKDSFEGTKTVDLMEWAEETGYSYDTLESSKVTKTVKSKSE